MSCCTGHLVLMVQQGTFIEWKISPSICIHVITQILQIVGIHNLITGLDFPQCSIFVGWKDLFYYES